MIGDSAANDVAFAKAAGASTVLLDTGRRHTEGGSDGGADHVIATLSEVPRLLLASFDVHVPTFEKSKAPVPGTDAARRRASAGAAAPMPGRPVASLHFSSETPLFGMTR